MRPLRNVLIVAVALLCVVSALAQKPLTKPSKPEVQSSTSKPSSDSATKSTAKSATRTNSINGHEYVDLGLSVKWATCNVGASSPSDYGDYYAWGEIRTKSSYTAENSETYGKVMPTPNERVYELYNNLKNDNYDVKDYSDFKEKLSNDAARKFLYNNMKADNYDLPEYEQFSSDLGYGAGVATRASSIAGSATYDAAHANWGATWRLPTKAEIDELINKCKREWTTQGGHKGYKVTGPNGNSIFLPAAGWRNGTSLGDAGEYGGYWSATPYEDSTYGAYGLYFNSSGFNRNWDSREYGQSVRPVSE